MFSSYLSLPSLKTTEIVIDIAISRAHDSPFESHNQTENKKKKEEGNDCRIELLPKLAPTKISSSVISLLLFVNFYFALRFYCFGKNLIGRYYLFIVLRRLFLSHFLNFYSLR